MKAITENVLREYIEEVGSGGLVYSSSLVNLLQEIDTLTVSKPRPMSDAEITEGCVLLLKVRGTNVLKPCIYIPATLDSAEHWVSVDCDIFYGADIEGWVPLPIYKPELTVDGEKTAG